MWDGRWKALKNKRGNELSRGVGGVESDTTS